MYLVVPYNVLLSICFPHYFYATAKDMEDMTLDELDELEDDEEERVLEQYRQQRIAQIKSLQEKSRY